MLGRIAVTGGPAGGKTTVVRFLSELGARTASADEVAASLWDDPAWRSQVGRVLRLTGPVDRSAVRARIVADPDARRALNQVSHPAILARLAALRADVIEVPLLVEAVLFGRFREVWVADCGEAEQRRRLAERLGDEASARDFLRTQLPVRVKLAFADRVLRTNQPLSDVQNDVADAWNRVVG